MGPTVIFPGTHLLGKGLARMAPKAVRKWRGQEFSEEDMRWMALMHSDSVDAANDGYAMMALQPDPDSASEIDKRRQKQREKRERWWRRLREDTAGASARVGGGSVQGGSGGGGAAAVGAIGDAAGAGTLNNNNSSSGARTSTRSLIHHST